ncbi:MAG TPA: DUF2934 domain-containing protein [Candidatus Acidoferrum sp.]
MSKTSRSSSSALKKPQASKNSPTHEEIAMRAYEIYLGRGGAPGHELEDWTQAERELLEKKRKPHGKAGPTLVAA